MGFWSDLGNALSGGGGNSNGGGDRRREEDKAAKDKQDRYDRNQEAAAMYDKMEKDKKEKDDKPRPKPATAPAPTPTPTPPPVVPPPTPVPPPAPLPVVPSEPPTSAVEAAAIESTQGGRQSTILTSALGLLADQEAQGLLRPRRSLMSGGMIQ
jgi:hypothetical protein